MGYLHSSICNISLQNIFNYKRKRNNFTVEKPGRVHLIKWSMLISPVMGQEEMMCNLTETMKGHRTTSVVFLSKISIMSLLINRRPAYSKGTVYKITGQKLFKNTKIIKVQGRLRNCSSKNNYSRIPRKP